jgi:hypothetical protein
MQILFRGPARLKVNFIFEYDDFAVGVHLHRLKLRGHGRRRLFLRRLYV